MKSKKYSVLVVDDEPDVVEIIVSLLGDLGISRVVTASNGLDAYNICVERIRGGEVFDLIISDWRMPKMNGLDFLHTIRWNSFTKNIPFMFVTGAIDRNSIDQAIGSKANQYLMKPFKSQDFDSKVRQILDVKAA